MWATAFDQHPLMEMFRRTRTGDELYRQLRERGITHLYVNRSELQRLNKNYGYLREANWLQFQTLAEGHAKAIHVSDWGVVYELIDGKIP